MASRLTPHKSRGGIHTWYSPPGPGAYEVRAAESLKFDVPPSPSFAGRMASVDRATTGLMAEVVRNSTPGPGHYGSRRDSIGKQVDSKRSSQPMPVFGTGTREALGKTFHTELREARQPNRETPGPGTYVPHQGYTITRPRSPSPSFGGAMSQMNRTKTGALADSLRSFTPGPGAYSSAPMTGATPVSGKRSSQRAPFGTGPRFDTSSKPDLPPSPPQRPNSSPGLKYAGARPATGKQPDSKRATAPSFTFGVRQMEEELYIAKGGDTLIRRPKSSLAHGVASEASVDVSRAALRSSASPKPPEYRFSTDMRFREEAKRKATGGSYDVRGQIGDDALAFSFPKDQRVPEAIVRARKQGIPGPGTYDTSVADSMRPQVMSRRASSPRPSFGERLAQAAQKQYYSPGVMAGGGDPNAMSAGKDTPGPGHYTSHAVSPVSTRARTPSFSFGGKGIKRGEQPGGVPAVGPGSYRATTAVGSQPVSRSPNAPAFSFGTSSRNASQLVSSPGVQPESKDVKKVPGPGAYADLSTSSLGRQTLSPRHSYGGVGFGYGDRLKHGLADVSKLANPGPGEYASPASVGRQSLSRRSNAPAVPFGTSHRQGIVQLPG